MGVAYFGMMVPIIAIVTPFVMIIIMVVHKERTKREQNKLKAETIAKAIENGMSLPEKFFDEPEKPRRQFNKQTCRFWGLISIAIGISGCLAHLIQPNITYLQVGVLLILLGVAFVFASFLAKEQKDEKKD